MSVITSTAQEAQISRMADLACRGYNQSAVQILNQCPLPEGLKTKIENIINQGPASDNLKQATALMKSGILAVLNGEEITSGPGPLANSTTQMTLLNQREYICLPTMTSFSYLLNMPTEIFQIIASHIDPQAITTCGLVCKQWCMIFNADPIWRNLLSEHYSLNNTNANKNFHAAYQSIRFNLSKGVCSQKTLDGSYRMIDIIDGKLISGDWNGGIKISNLQSGERRATSENVCKDESPLCCTTDGKLVSKCEGSHVSIWDLENDQCVKTFPEPVVSSAIANEKSLFLSTWEGIKVYDLETGEYTILPNDVQNPTFACPHVIANGKLFASSGINRNTIQVWDLKSHQCILSFHPYADDDGVDSIVVSDGKLFTSSWNNKTIKVWDLNTNKEIKDLSALLEKADTFAVAHGKFFAYCHSSDALIIKIWDLNSQTSITMPLGAKKISLGSLKLSSWKLVVKNDAGYGDQFKIFDFTADHLTIFEELAVALEALEDPNAGNDYSYIMERFSKMPKDAQNAIFEKFSKIIQNDDPEYVEYAFMGFYGQSPTPEQKAQAIRNYLAEQRSKS